MAFQTDAHIKPKKQQHNEKVLKACGALNVYANDLFPHASVSPPNDFVEETRASEQKR